MHDLFHFTGDSLVYPHANQKFSTKDRDNDNSDENFAQLFKGAWWHNKIYTSNLNGLYPRNNTDYRLAGIVWHPGFNRSDFKKKASMKLRPTVHPGLWNNTKTGRTHYTNSEKTDTETMGMTTIYADERLRPAIFSVVLSIVDVSLKAIANANADDDVYPLYASLI